ncbi:uncharacterized protein BO96DRAFT_431940 [Aspergillus niger CBS 101883]|uniref:uncharacterized protein n=1 Tax=Aspergillus lacticoffeatus (strain CBS 101883) TaxID=1450533 RepID=UPI000D7FE659|nr:uncharacterized protein BO96DRAFT_431940 [Aspergillus niger CBS 101883]PYH58835.1 hypothetical protein BO96DRAFT_431940 [Aspergillus niger CBS 101883]
MGGEDIAAAVGQSHNRRLEVETGKAGATTTASSRGTEVLARDAGGGKKAGETAKQRKDAEPKRGVGWFSWRKASENDDLTLKRVVKVDRGGDDVGEWMRARISSEIMEEGDEMGWDGMGWGGRMRGREYERELGIITVVGRERMGWGWDGIDGPVVDVSQSSSRQVEVEMAERRRRITYSLDRRGAGGYLGKTWTGRPKLTASERHKGRAKEGGVKPKHFFTQQQNPPRERRYAAERRLRVDSNVNAIRLLITIARQQFALGSTSIARRLRTSSFLDFEDMDRDGRVKAGVMWYFPHCRNVPPLCNNSLQI